MPDINKDIFDGGGSKPPWTWSSFRALITVGVLTLLGGLAVYLQRPRERPETSKLRFPPELLMPSPEVGSEDRDEDHLPGAPRDAAKDDDTVDELIKLLKPPPPSASPERKAHAERARKAFEAEPAIRRHYAEFAKKRNPTKADRREFLEGLKKIPEFRRIAERFYTAGVPATHMAVIAGARGPAAQEAALRAMGLPVSAPRVASFQEAASRWLKLAKERVPGISPSSTVNLVSKGNFGAAGAGPGGGAGGGLGFTGGGLGQSGAGAGGSGPTKVNLGGGGEGGGGKGKEPDGPSGIMQAHDVDPELKKKLEDAQQQLSQFKAAAAGTSKDQIIDGRMKRLLEKYPWLANMGIDELRDAVRQSGAGDLIMNYGTWGACFALGDKQSGPGLYDKCFQACQAGKGALAEGSTPCDIDLPSATKAWEYCMNSQQGDQRCLKLCNAIVTSNGCRPDAAVVQKYCDPSWAWKPTVYEWVGDPPVQVVKERGYWYKGNNSLPAAECSDSQRRQFSNANGDAKVGYVDRYDDPGGGPSATTTTRPTTTTTGGNTTTTEETTTTTPADATTTTTTTPPPAMLTEAQLDRKLDELSGCAGKTGWDAIICYDNFSYRQRGTAEDAQIGAAAYYRAAQISLEMARDYYAQGDRQKGDAMADLARDHFGKVNLVGGSPFGTYAQTGYIEASKLNPTGTDTRAKNWGDWWPPDEDPFGF